MYINKELRLPVSEYYGEIVPKTQIYLHHTVGGNVRGSIGHWLTDPQKIGTAFLVERNGEVFEVFPPEKFAHHLGLKTDFNRKANMQSIGIEICSEGALRTGEELNKILEKNNVISKFKNDVLYAFDINQDNSKSPTQWFKNAKPLYNLTQTHLYVDLRQTWRGYRYFDAYDEKQLKSVFELVKFLCEAFNISKNVVPHREFDVNLANNFNGVLAHSNVRADKTDVHLLFPWDELSKYLNT